VWGARKGFWGGGGHFGPNLHATVRNFFVDAFCPTLTINRDYFATEYPLNLHRIASIGSVAVHLSSCLLHSECCFCVILERSICVPLLIVPDPR